MLSKITAAQPKTSTDDKAYQLLDKAIGSLFTSSNVGMYFEAIAFGIKTPESIFTLPVYKVFKGGFLFVNDDKFQIELGLMKSISDGKVTVIVNEQTKMMIVDSVRANNDSADINSQELESLLNDDFKDAVLTYVDVVTINNHKCHKITSNVKKNSSAADVIYWIDTTTGQLYLMAEKDNEAYNVYWLNKMGKAPANQSYTIYLPSKTLTTYHGYKVVDNRFTDEEYK
jgi:hypothetical protein